MINSIFLGNSCISPFILKNQWNTFKKNKVDRGIELTILPKIWTIFIRDIFIFLRFLVRKFANCGASCRSTPLRKSIDSFWWNLIISQKFNFQIEMLKLFSLYKNRSKLKIFIKVNFYKKKSYFISIKNGYMYIHVNYNKKFHYQKNLYNCILFAKDKNFLQKKRRKIEYKNIKRWS